MRRTILASIAGLLFIAPLARADEQSDLTSFANATGRCLAVYSTVLRVHGMAVVASAKSINLDLASRLPTMRDLAATAEQMRSASDDLEAGFISHLAGSAVLIEEVTRLNALRLKVFSETRQGMWLRFGEVADDADKLDALLEAAFIEVEECDGLITDLTAGNDTD